MSHPTYPSKYLKKIALVLALGAIPGMSSAFVTTLYKIVNGKIVAYTVDTTATTTPVVATPVVTTPVVTTPVVTTPVTTSTTAWGTYLKPFAATSLWNSRAVSPVFGTFVVPTSSYYPTVGGGLYSTGAFKAAATDKPVTVGGLYTTAGAWDPDSGTYHTVTIPHWPAGVIPAAGSDGHADIVDEAAGVIHSFWKLKQVNGAWVAAQYAWMPLNGRGFGDIAHYYQGARAVGVPASAGLIRKSEINDGTTAYTHALAMSLTYNALSASPTYIYPATSADSDAAKTNTGKIPEGALMMLPPSYVTSTIANADLRKIAETLKTYGAYVVDRNTGTPFVIYVENDSGFSLMPSGWNNTVAAELDRMRAGLRQVVSAASWVDGNGKASTQANSLVVADSMNTLSMRGGWTMTSGTAPGVFDTATQKLIFPVTAKATVMRNGNSTGLGSVSWADRAGKTQRFTVHATGGALLRLTVWVGGSQVFDTGYLGDGQSARFVWPASGAWTTIYASGGINQASSLSADLQTVTP